MKCLCTSERRHMHNFAHAKVVRNGEVGHGVICFREGVETGSLDAEAARGGLLLGASACCCWADYWGVLRKEGGSQWNRKRRSHPFRN